MNRVQIFVAIFILPAIAVLALVGGLNLMENEAENENATEGNFSELSNNSIKSLREAEDIPPKEDNSSDNSSEEASPDKELNFLREQRIKPLKGEISIDEALTRFVENSSDLTREFVRPGTSSVFIYENSDSEALVFLQSSGEEGNYIEMAVEGLESAEAIRGEDFIRQKDEDRSFYSVSWNLSSNEINGTAFRLDESVNVTISQALPSSMKWQLISGPREDMRVIELDNEKPLSIRTD